MITRDGELQFDYGLSTLFDGDTYHLITNQNEEEYPIGGLICEYMRLAPLEVKDVLLSCDGLDKEGTVENYIDTIIQFHTKINEVFPPVISTMVALEFMNSGADWFRAVREKKVKEYLNAFKQISDIVKQCVFENTGCDKPRGKTVLEIMLISFCFFASTYILTKSMFEKLMESDEIDDEEHRKGIDIFISMYGKHMDWQHIDYRLILTKKGFESLYTIKTSFSLLIFDLAHVFNGNNVIVKCKNCDNYFVPRGRSDAVYCSYPIKENNGKTCRDVGAQITRANKEKNDEATKEYRKVYMRYKMTLNRHPENIEVSTKFRQLTSEVREWRNKMAHGQVNTEDFIKWLSQF